MIAARIAGWAVAAAAAMSPALGQDGLGSGHGADGRNMALVGHSDLQGRSAFQAVIVKQGERWIAYVGHHGGAALNPLTGRKEPNGTSIVEVTDPRKPRIIHHLATESDEVVAGGEGGGAQMVQICAGRSLPKGDPSKYYMMRTDGSRAHEVWDVTTPERPVRIAILAQNLRSTHRQAWECDTGIAYVNSGLPEWQVQRMTQVYDLSDPAQPAHIRDFALPGQEPTAPKRANRRLYDGHGAFSTGPAGNRLYFGYGYVGSGGFQIVDRRKLLEGPKEPTPENLLYPQVSFQAVGTWQAVHSVYPLIGMEVSEFASSTRGAMRDFLLVLPEAIANECQEERQMMFVVDITDDAKPFGVANFQVPHQDGNYCTRGGRFGPHQTQENLTPIYHKRIVLVAWFNAGVRAVDIRDPYHPKEIGHYLPATTQNTEPSCVKSGGGVRCKIAIVTNNVEVDDRGYIYMTDRAKTGLHILELTGEARKIANYPK
ncbi:MAG: LVIVD repeat-containing protein [Burkholderiales bacterium]